MATIEETRITEKSPWFVGLIFLVIGLGVVIGCSIGRVYEETWIPFIIGGVFAVIGFLGMLYVYEFTIDLIARKWTMLKGWRWSATEQSGDFSAFDHLGFTREIRSSGSGKNHSTYTVWCVRLKWTAEFQSRFGDINLGESRSENEGHRLLESCAKKLGLKTMDLTGDAPVERTAGEMDLTLKERARTAPRADGSAGGDISALATPPPGAKATVEVGLEGLHVAFPRGQSIAAGCFLLFFSLFWNGITWTMVIATLLGEGSSDMPRWGAMLFMLPFIAVGLVTALLALSMFIAREHLEVSPDTVTRYVAFLGRRWGRVELKSAEVEEIKLAKDSSGGRTITIRSDAGIIHTGGRSSAGEQEWLVKVITEVVSA